MSQRVGYGRRQEASYITRHQRSLEKMCQRCLRYDSIVCELVTTYTVEPLLEDTPHPSITDYNPHNV